MAITLLDIHTAVSQMRSGNVVAYPTEAVYGLGCDPHQASAVHQILAMKQRPVSAGLILIASTPDQVSPYVSQDLPESVWQSALSHWPGPTTCLLPVSDKVPKWICGEHNTIALRVTAHPVVVELCNAFNGCIVSTSANVRGEPAITDPAELACFSALSGVVEGALGSNANPSRIIDVVNNKILRG